MADIVAVIVTYNRVEKLQKAYEAACREPLKGIVIINNASIDGTGKWLESIQGSRVTIINLPENTGGAGGFHEGFKCALKKYRPEWIVCFDDDAYPQNGVIRKFTENIYPQHVGGVVSAVYLPNGAICDMNRPSMDPFSDRRIAVRTIRKGTAAFHLGDGPYQAKKPTDVDAGSFVGLFIRSKVITQHIGLPRKELFLYGDDTIYTLMLRRAKFRLVFDPGLVFIHDTTTLSNSRNIYQPLWKVYYSYRNGLEIYRLVAGNLFPIVAIFKLASWLNKVRFYKEKRTYLKLFGYGFIDGLLRKFDRKHQEVEALEKV